MWEICICIIIFIKPKVNPPLTPSCKRCVWWWYRNRNYKLSLFSDYGCFNASTYDCKSRVSSVTAFCILKSQKHINNIYVCSRRRGLRGKKQVRGFLPFRPISQNTCPAGLLLLLLHCTAPGCELWYNIDHETVYINTTRRESIIEISFLTICKTRKTYAKIVHEGNVPHLRNAATQS